MSESNHRFVECIQRARALGPLIVEHAAESERLGQLSIKVVDAFHDAGLFRVLLPVRMGGFNLTIAQQCEVIEEVARFDGATGWNLAIGSGGPAVGSFVAREAFESIFADPRALCAGSFNPVGNSSVACEGGYRFTGKMTYASGSAQATWLAANGVELVNGAPQIVNGVPKFRAGIFPIKSGKVLNTWSVSGLRGTGSNDVLFENVFVPDVLHLRISQSEDHLADRAAGEDSADDSTWREPRRRRARHRAACDRRAQRACGEQSTARHDGVAARTSDRATPTGRSGRKAAGGQVLPAQQYRRELEARRSGR